MPGGSRRAHTSQNVLYYDCVGRGDAEEVAGEIGDTETARGGWQGLCPCVETQNAGEPRMTVPGHR